MIGKQVYQSMLSPAHRGRHKCVSENPSEQNFTKIGVHALGTSMNQNLKCHIDWCKWAWPVRYLVQKYNVVLWCDNAVVKVWLGLGTKTTWLGLGKDHGLG